MSLYLKYRPQDFDNLVGQNFINKTLKKAISENKTVGAYLFCGPRGTGKTSTARLFAKTVNCLKGKEGNPCLKCDICKDFLEEKLVDIIEIDAASHTGVENIREIIGKANFTPTKTTYKIYIIDEVHMLSKGAFNALLKILEEPPKHVKFILATTETHKVPETIISRCQRYDFRKITGDIIKKRLLYIAKQENIQIDEKSLEYIQKQSSGGLRNAISLFEQLNDSGVIKFEDIIEKLGIVSFDKLSIFSDKLINKDISIIEDFEKIISDGNNLKLFFKELIFFIKDKAILNIKKGEDINNILYILDVLDKTYTNTKNSLDENTTFLIGILKILNTGEDKYKELVSSGNMKVPLNKETHPSSITFQSTSLEKGINNKEELTHDDIGDIFGESEVPVKNNINNNNNNKVFDKEGFIKKLKENGGKGGLTMGIRGSEINIIGDKINFTFKTGFALKQVNSPDNLNLLNKSLEDLELNYKIILS